MHVLKRKIAMTIAILMMFTTLIQPLMVYAAKSNDVANDIGIEESDKEKIPETEKLPETETTEIQNDKETTTAIEVDVDKKLLCSDENCITKHVGRTLKPEDISPILSGVRKKNFRSLAQSVEPYVGMTTSGTNADVTFLGADPNAPGDFAVSFNDGEYLSGIYIEGFQCLNHGAANPGVNGSVQCSYTATVVDINEATGKVRWSIVITPPGVCAEGSTLGYQRVGGILETSWEFEKFGDIELIKKSANPELTNNNDCYSLEGAEYGVYIPGQGTSPIAKLVTDKKGYAKVTNIPVGDYWIKELVAPKGFALDKKSYHVVVPVGGIATLNVTDTPQNDPAPILLGKIDKETNANKPQGSGSLENAEFTISYYPNYDTSGKPVRTWVVKTDKDGFTELNDEFKVSGDDFYYRSNGDVTLPLGSITIKETKAPEGYLINEEVFVRKIMPDGIAEIVNTYNKPIIPETPQKGIINLNKIDKETGGAAQGITTLEGAIYEVFDSSKVVDTLITNKEGKATSKELPLGKYTVKEKVAPTGFLLDPKEYTVVLAAENTTDRIFYETVTSTEQIVRGDVEIIKLAESQDPDDDTPIGLEGVEFTFTSKSTNKEVIKITTDKNGFATTASAAHPKGRLVYDTYIVTETKCPEGYKPIEPFEVKIVEDGVTLKGIYKEDKLIVSPVTVIKKDKGTGQIIPVKNTEFRLLDSNKNPITMTTYYPNKEVHETFKTDENGQFTFPSQLKYGTYFLEELNAPEGYLKGELLEFKVTKGSTWEKPLLIEYFDENVMGKIQIKKIDKKTDEPIKSAVFEVRAAENIRTLDGTLRLQKGEIADTITSKEDGIATSKELYLGKYVLKEVQAPLGFALEDKSYDVELTYKDQNTEIVTESLVIKNKPTTIVINKKEKDSDKTLAGVTFNVWNKITGEEVDGEFSRKEDYVTDKNGQIKIQYLPAGTYCIQELKTIIGYCLNDEIQEFTVDDNGLIDGAASAEFNFENEATQIVKTTALDRDTNSHNAIAQKETIFIDTVEFSGLNVGQEYEVKGTLHNAANGNVIKDAAGEEVKATATFTAEAKDGKADVEFHFDASKLQGITTVVFEDLYQDGIKIYTHADLNDKGQTIKFPEITMGTTATDKSSGNHDMKNPSESATIVDTVSISGIPTGTTGTFELKGNLVEFGTGNEIKINGQPVTASKTYNEATDTVTMEFNFDATKLLNTDVTVYEELYYNGTKIAEHKDANDEGQTVHIKGKGTIITSTPSNFRSGSATVRTGDLTNLSIVFGMMIVAALAIGGTIFYKKRKMVIADVEDKEHKE